MRRVFQITAERFFKLQQSVFQITAAQLFYSKKMLQQFSDESANQSTYF